MIKRKYGNRPNWKRVIKKDYTQTFIDTNELRGYVSLLKINKVTEPLSFSYEGNNICTVDDGYTWLQQFPLNKRHSVTTMFDSNDDIVQWYIDICVENGIENNIAYMDDLFLDIVLLPSGEIIQKDVDELEEAFLKGIIDLPLYEAAWKEANDIHELIKRGDFQLIHLSEVHRSLLEREIDEN